MLLLMSQADHSSPTFSTSPTLSSRRATPRRSRSITEPLSPNSTARGKGGCWTCRLRRKKCDEQQEGGCCHTCLRLKIDCLGWGVKRPDWMRDKAAVEEYKTRIKQQLTTQGMIRGQPRTPNTKPMTTPRVPSFAMPPPLHHYVVSSNSPTFIHHLSGGSGDEADYDLYGSSSSSSVSDTMGPNFGHESQHGRAPRDSPFQHEHSWQLPPPTADLHPELSPGQELAHSFQFFPSLDPPLPMYTPSRPPSSLSRIDTSTLMSFPAQHDAPTFDSAPSTALPPTAVPHYITPAPTPQDSSREYHVFYYFQQVRNLQYPFAGLDLTNLIHDIIVREPLGPVTNAVCALAAMHERLTRISPGLHVEDTADTAVENRYYDQAAWQISNSKQQTGQYSDMDAMAAVHMISFWLFSGGSGDWAGVLDVACEWLLQQPMTMDENPLMALLKLSNTAKFIAKATMWMDIFASVTVMRPPRFLSLYRRLLRGGGGFWAARRGPGYDDVRMDGLMGCPDEVMLAIAETSNLAHWKHQQTMNGCLSIRELVRRGDAIEKELRSTTEPRWRRSTGASSSPEFHTGPVPGSARAAGAVSLPNTPGASSPRHEDARALPDLEEDIRALVSDVFREASLVYLHGVVADPYPRVPEVATSAKSTMDSLRLLPASIIDRTLVFPISMAAFVTDGPAEREFFRSRLAAQDLSVGNVGPALKIIEGVWELRDTRGGAVSWRDVMREMGMYLLLV